MKSSHKTHSLLAVRGECTLFDWTEFCVPMSSLNVKKNQNVNISPVVIKSRNNLQKSIQWNCINRWTPKAQEFLEFSTCWCFKSFVTTFVFRFGRPQMSSLNTYFSRPPRRLPGPTCWLQIHDKQSWKSAACDKILPHLENLALLCRDFKLIWSDYFKISKKSVRFCKLIEKGSIGICFLFRCLIFFYNY